MFEGHYSHWEEIRQNPFKQLLAVLNERHSLTPYPHAYMTLLDRNNPGKVVNAFVNVQVAAPHIEHD